MGILAGALNLTLELLLDQIPPFNQSFSSFRPTTLFLDILEEIRTQILGGERLIVIQGKSGIGKSRLASSFFFADLPDCTVLWFTGQTINDLEKLVFSLNQEIFNQSRQYILILDEDHQAPIRDTDFFRQLFQLPELDTIINQLILICTIRDDTY